MKSIALSSCHNCDTETWAIVREGNGIYKCNKCNHITNKVLERKRDLEKTDQNMEN